jgi:hypothetical protein
MFSSFLNGFDFQSNPLYCLFPDPLTWASPAVAWRPAGEAETGNAGEQPVKE